MTPLEVSHITTVCPAIKSKKLIKFWYSDKTKDRVGWRKVEPHQIGQFRKEKSKDESIVLTGWFLPTEEQLKMGWIEKWGNYILERMNDVEVLNESYKCTREGYNPTDEKRMSIVFCATDECRG